MPDITDENKNALLLRYARNGAASLLRLVLQAGANVAHTEEVCVIGEGWNAKEWCARLVVCVCLVHVNVQCAVYIRACGMRTRRVLYIYVCVCDTRLLPQAHVHACCHAFTNAYRTTARPCFGRASTGMRQRLRS